MTKASTQNIDLIEIARSQAIGPISAGADLAKIGPLLGMPDSWQFDPNEEFFNCWMDFGDVDVGFSAINNIVRVTWAKFYMAAFDDGLLKFTRTTKRKVMRIHNNFGESEPSFSVVSAEMQKQGIQFSAKIISYVPEETWGVMHFGKHMKFWFECRDEEFSWPKCKLNFVATTMNPDDFPEKTIP